MDGIQRRQQLQKVDHGHNTVGGLGLPIGYCTISFEQHHMNHRSITTSMTNFRLVSFLHHRHESLSRYNRLVEHIHNKTQCQHQQQRRLFFRLLSKQNDNVPMTGSIARDLLATERTFLAWARTGLGFVGAGSAMFAAYHRNNINNNATAATTVSSSAATTSADEEDESKEDTPKRNHHHQQQQQSINLRMDIVLPSGILICNGAFLLLFATRRYMKVVNALQSSDKLFPIDTKGTLMAIIITAIGTITSLGLIVQTELSLSSSQSQKADDDGQCASS